MNLAQLLDWMRSAESVKRNVTSWEVIPARPARHLPFPSTVDPRLVAALRERGIRDLYCHQAQAAEAVLGGEDVVVVTPTASGKTLCYNLPVLNTILHDSSARSLYLFPTKALAQDQVAELQEIGSSLGADIKTYTYDGDTPPSARQAIRQAGHIVVTNPDMLHTGILPHHTKWVKLFENLRYVVIDEVHHYRGVFGSHLANVIRRLKRICRFYGSNPVFICCSATIANPRELAERLIDKKVRLIDDNGAPRGEKHFIFYNPPVVNKELGIRRSSALEAKGIAGNFLKNGIQTIVFARSRMRTELLLTYLREAVPGMQKRVRGYRGGYLPLQRREIERGLRSGEVLGVVSTNALELGIDIGQLDACVMVGYPGSVSSAWQQAGRAGRRSGLSAAVLVASSDPLDQYMVTHPEYFFGRSPEHGLINPDNLLILVSHLKCAAFELPFEDGEAFGVETTAEILEFLEEEKILRHAGHKWHWMSDSFPAEEISLRSAGADNFVIIDTTEPAHRVIGEVDRIAARTLVHDEAVYLHESQQYHVDKLNWEEKKAYVHKVDVDYYTDANLAVAIKVIDEFRAGGGPTGGRSYGEVMVTAMATIFKKIKLHTHENIGWGKIHLPEEQMHTTAYWLHLSDDLASAFSGDELQSALLGISNVLVNVAPLYLMCDSRDVRAVTQVRSPFGNRPTIFLYDAYPGGIGLAEKLYDIHSLLVSAALDVIRGCSCEMGCPSCVGPANEVGPAGKAGAIRILEGLLASAEHEARPSSGV